MSRADHESDQAGLSLLERRLSAALAARADSVDEAALGPARPLVALPPRAARRVAAWRPLVAAAAVLALAGGVGVGAIALRSGPADRPAVNEADRPAPVAAFEPTDPLREDPTLEGALDTDSTAAAAHLADAGEPWCPDRAPTVSVPRTQAIAAVYVCRHVRSERMTGDGTWIAAAERVTSDFDPVLRQARAAREAARQREPGPMACVGYSVPQYWLHLRDGRVIRWAPLVADACGEPSAEDRQLWTAVRTTPVATARGPHADAALGSTPEDRAVALEKETGCSSSWKDMIALDAEGLKPASGPVPSLAGRERHVCVYRVRDAGEGEGLLVGGQTWDAARSGLLTESLRKASSGSGCRPGGHSLFAVVIPGTDDGELTVPLDGCGLMVGSRWWTAPTSVRDLLLGVPHE